MFNPDTNDTAAAVYAGRLSTAPHELNEDVRFHVVSTPVGLEVIDLEERRERFRDRPRRKTGTVLVQTPDAAVDYLSRHAVAGETDIFAVEVDTANAQLVAVINAHGKDEPGYGDHRLILSPAVTPEWRAWAGLDREMVDHTRFAEHIEENQPDIASPPAATMLELAQSFQAHRGAMYESGTRLSSGEVTLVYREDTAAKAGRRGDITIPDTFTLGIEPFHGAGRYSVLARFRYRLREGELRLGYVLDRPHEVLRKAFGDFANDVSAATGISVWPGSPAGGPARSR